MELNAVSDRTNYFTSFPGTVYFLPLLSARLLECVLCCVWPVGL